MTLGQKLGAHLSERFPWMWEPVMNAIEKKVIYEAKGLRSEHGENPEYDRALVELSMRILNLSEDDREELIYRILKERSD